MNSNEMIFNVIEIGLQKMFYLETDMIMQSNVVLCSFAAFSCYISMFYQRELISLI